MERPPPGQGGVVKRRKQARRSGKMGAVEKGQPLQEQEYGGRDDDIQGIVCRLHRGQVLVSRKVFSLQEIRGVSPR